MFFAGEQILYRRAQDTGNDRQIFCVSAGSSGSPVAYDCAGNADCFCKIPLLPELPVNQLKDSAYGVQWNHPFANCTKSIFETRQMHKSKINSENDIDKFENRNYDTNTGNKA